jgi:uncharacterized protein YjeT (DUF2065 family)
MIGAGTGLILYTEAARRFFQQLSERVSEKLYAAAAIVFGVLFLFSAASSRNFGVIVFLGLLLIVDGIVCAINPKQIYQMCMTWLSENASNQTYRLFGIVKLILGTAVFSWVA